MKIVAFVGSPRKNGNCAFITKNLTEKLEKKGHDCQTFYLYDQTVKGCIACDACTEQTVEICIHDDDFNKMAQEIIKADAMIFASPIYMGQITGVLKLFVDRWYTFADEKFAIRHVQGKKFVVVTASGAPAEQFAGVAEYLKYWFGDFFKMQACGCIVGGELSEAGEAKKRSDILQEIDKVVASF